VKHELKRRMAATGRPEILLRLVARAMRRRILTDVDLLRLCSLEEELILLDDELPALREQLMSLLRDLAEGKRDPAVVLGQKRRRGRKSKDQDRWEVISAYWSIRYSLPKTKRPHADTCKLLRSKYPQWQYTDRTLRQWQKAAGPQARMLPATAEDFDILP
jgi:hypothetical protein